jgi:hypothetical protein
MNFLRYSNFLEFLIAFGTFVTEAQSTPKVLTSGPADTLAATVALPGSKSLTTHMNSQMIFEFNDFVRISKRD